MLNKGITFGLFPGLSFWVFGIVLFVLVIYAVKLRELWGRVGIGIIVLGGTWNLVSRLMYGGVVDNWNLFGLVYNNLADYLIFIGLVVYGYSNYFRRQ